MPPARPALPSCRAHQVIRWSAASTSAGGSSRPVRPAFPDGSAHRCTRARFAECSRRCFACSGFTCITARLIADRNPAGVNDPARSRTMASAARASAGSSSMVAAAMISALSWVRTPDRNAARVPGKLISSARPAITSSASPDDRASAAPSSRHTNSSHSPGSRSHSTAARGGTAAEQLRDRGMFPGTGIGLDPVPPADHPEQLIIRDPGYRSSSPAASSAN